MGDKVLGLRLVFLLTFRPTSGVRNGGYIRVQSRMDRLEGDGIREKTKDRVVRKRREKTIRRKP